jgi:acetylornithine/succinyldiaminopimelate/putrescine aminotransferase
MVFDETQSGLGRCGKKFYLEHSGVVPDVLVIGEALGAGVFPIAATVFTKSSTGL